MCQQLIGLLIDLAQLDVWPLIYEYGLSSGFGMLVYFKSLSLIEFQDRYLLLFCLFSVIDGLKWLCWCWSSSKLHSKLKVLHFSSYSLMAFLIILFIILCYDISIYLYTYIYIYIYIYIFMIYIYNIVLCWWYYYTLQV